ncbi:MAG: PQQ-binding-like beta-propeller repeat protein [Pirellulaceae bacterium]
MYRLVIAFTLFTFTVHTLPNTLGQTDWPQWMGPGRDNVWNTTDVLNKFPAGGPKVLWRTPIAGGYAGPAVVGDRVYVTDYVTKENVKVDNFDRKEFSGQERVLCLDAKSGKEIWKKEYSVKYTISYPAGPRSTPIVDGDHVYTLGAEGDLICFAAKDGKIVWQKNLREAYSTKTPLWGYSAHPLINGDHLITLAGGNGSHAVALNKKDGTEIWRTVSAKEQGYSPPTIIEAGGERQLILANPSSVTSVDPETGKEYWSLPYEATSGSIIMSPVRIGEYLYIAGYSNKSLLIKLATDKPGAEEVWRDKAREAISPVNVQPFVIDDVVYGFHQNGELVALKIPQGERLWSTPKPIGSKRFDSGTAFLVKQADRFWLFNDIGELVIAKITPAGYEEIDRAKVIEPSNLAFGRKVVWSMPAFAGTKIYIRNDDEIICVDVAK